MKSLPVILLALLLCSWGCKNRSHAVQSVSALNSDTTEISIDQVVEIAPDADTLAEYRDTLIGRFNGVDIDTLIAEPLLSEMDYGGFHFKWQVIAKNNTVKPLFFYMSTIGIHFINEGDLDGNGTDEWGFVTEWPTSCWMFYKAYTYINGEWHFIIKPTSIWLPHIDPQDSIYGFYTEEDLIQSSDNSEFLRVKFSDIRNDGGDFLLIDTLIQINPQPIEEF